MCNLGIDGEMVHYSLNMSVRLHEGSPVDWGTMRRHIPKA